MAQEHFAAEHRVARRWRSPGRGTAAGGHGASWRVRKADSTTSRSSASARASASTAGGSATSSRHHRLRRRHHPGAHSRRGGRRSGHHVPAPSTAVATSCARRCAPARARCTSPERRPTRKSHAGRARHPPARRSSSSQPRRSRPSAAEQGGGEVERAAPRWSTDGGRGPGPGAVEYPPVDHTAESAGTRRRRRRARARAPVSHRGGPVLQPRGLVRPRRQADGVALVLAGIVPLLRFDPPRGPRRGQPGDWIEVPVCDSRRSPRWPGPGGSLVVAQRPGMKLELVVAGYFTGSAGACGDGRSAEPSTPRSRRAPTEPSAVGSWDAAAEKSPS